MPMFWAAEERHALKGTSLWEKCVGLWQLPGASLDPPVQVIADMLIACLHVTTLFTPVSLQNSRLHMLPS